MYKNKLSILLLLFICSFFDTILSSTLFKLYIFFELFKLCKNAM